MLDEKARESKRWPKSKSGGVRDCFTNRIPLMNHPVWTAGGFKTGRNGIPTWKCGLRAWILQKNISCQTPRRKGAGEGPCFRLGSKPQPGGGGACLTRPPQVWPCTTQYPGRKGGGGRGQSPGRGARYWSRCGNVRMPVFATKEKREHWRS